MPGAKHLHCTVIHVQFFVKTGYIRFWYCIAMSLQWTVTCMKLCICTNFSIINLFVYFNFLFLLNMKSIYLILSGPLSHCLSSSSMVEESTVNGKFQN